MASGKAGGPGGARRVRTLFLSDLQLGFRRARGAAARAARRAGFLADAAAKGCPLRWLRAAVPL